MNLLDEYQKYHLLPLITEYYRATASYEGLLKRIDDEFEDGYYRFSTVKIS